METVADMLASVRAAFTQTAGFTGCAVPDPDVEAVMRRVPRDRFVPPEFSEFAFADRALGIGYGATISQPFIVALMTTLARLRPTDRVLEIGTGSGYEAAILAELTAEVFSLEIVPALRVRSAAVLAELGYDNVQVFAGNGWLGLPDHAPFDAILVTACAAEEPAALTAELAPGRRMVLPMDMTGRTTQQLCVVERRADGTIDRDVVLPVNFVPMVSRPE